MIFNRKIEIEFSKEDGWRVDGQSKICNWLYNHLLEMTIGDFRDNDNQKQKIVKNETMRISMPMN